MSYVQQLGEIGGVINPAVMREAFEQVLLSRGQVIDLYHEIKEVDCACVNPTYSEPDRDCLLCNGTGKVGGWSVEPSATFIAAVFFSPEARQDQHQRLQTRAGPVTTMDGRMYCEARYWDPIHVGDLATYKPPGSSEGIELMVISKSPRIGNQGEIIFIRCDLERQATRQRLDATDIVDLI